MDFNLWITSKISAAASRNETHKFRQARDTGQPISVRQIVSIGTEVQVARDGIIQIGHFYPP